ncbi:G-protein alpha subunit-domain-containing protein [Catenaria anguillulae PL171]|uniref:G-protein alpha subunit-domain-containing protein n=1 Tax=Catenaria anguillulae PL171 TaxID=765915 RepID=A0A1Y2H957_9FUNG|nr:G-protein alpha subunit-domain-containing protein [Catenaria anguillulae PL171]
MVSAKDQVILDLRTDLARRDAYVQELALRISSLEHDVAAAEKRNADLASVIRKMYSVRQQMDSFVEDEPLVAEILRKPSASPALAHIGFAYWRRLPHKPITFTCQLAARAACDNVPPGPPLSESGAPITTGFESKDHLPTAPSRPRTEVYQPYPTTTTTSTRLASSNTPIPIRPPPPPPPYPATSATETVVPATPPSHHQHATGTSVDGRDFFRLARRTLSYDEFTSLLTNVKAFNARQQSRQTTLDNVVAVLGGRYPEIERAFVGLMMHGVASESGDHGRSTAAVASRRQLEEGLAGVENKRRARDSSKDRVAGRGCSMWWEQRCLGFEESGAAAVGQIDRQLALERKLDKETIKLLLLGTAASGKSTVLRQMKLINHGNIVDKNARTGAVMAAATKSVVAPDQSAGGAGKPEQGDTLMDEKDWARAVRNNLLDSVTNVIANMPEVGFAASTVQSHIADLRSDWTSVPKPEFLAALATLEADPTFQQAMQLGHKYELLDSTPVFLKQASVILDPSYVPTNEHILLARVPTKNITETSIQMQGIDFKVFDVNGASDKRNAWIPYFDSVLVIIFVVAMSSYDQLLPGSNGMTRLHDSLAFFEEVAKHPLLNKKPVLLFLNKTDVLKEKLTKGSSRVEYEPVTKFFMKKFAQLNPERKRKMWAHLTCATQTGQMKVVFTVMHKVIIQLNLQDVSSV